ncbi:MAG: hypothetical protein QM726_07760 [Chitinophagaceae bacterium]
MNKDLLNILSNGKSDVEKQQMLDYLAGKLSDEEKNRIEQELESDDFMNDAMEGLEQVKNKKDINLVVDQINRDLHKKLFQKKKKRRKLLQQRWVYAAVVLILALLISAWLMIMKYRALEKNHGKKTATNTSRITSFKAMQDSFYIS